MNHKQRSAPFTNIGSSSLLVVFLVLCLVTFAVLSLSSARSDDAFSEKLANRKTAYYTAVNRAEGVLSCIDTALEQVPNDNATLTHNERNADQGTLSYATQDTDHTDFTDIDESMDDTDSFDTAQNGNRMVSASAVPSADSTADDKETATALRAILALNDAGLPALDGISLTSTTGPDAAEPFISFQVPIDDRQHLQVTLEVSGNFYEIRTWQTLTDTDWESDDSIQLLPID